MPSNGQVGCVPNSISPSTWINGFSGTYTKKSDFMCAIAVSDAALVKTMGSSCCKGAVSADAAGCYHWCKPTALTLNEWAGCISDNVYTDTNFGQACNQPGELVAKSAASLGEDAPAGTSGAAQVGFSAGWKVGVLVGVVGLVQVLC